MPGPRQDMRRALFAQATEQSGYFTAAQALGIGYSYAAQKFHADHANWLRVDRGIYRLPEWPPGEHDSLVRWTLWSRGRGVVSHETALAVHELGDVSPPTVDLTVPRNFRPKAPGVRLHRGDLPDADVQGRQGFRITTPLRSLLDVAANNLEIDHLATAIADGIKIGAVTRRQLLSRVDEFGEHAALRVERALQVLPVER
jgi:predicted transcriptional regulator of viral defense system